MKRLLINLISWFIYSSISFPLLIAPMKDLEFRTISIICIAIIVGFAFGLINDVIRQLMIINNYAEYKPIPGTQLLCFNKKLQKKTLKELPIKYAVTIFIWNCFKKNRFKHYVLCLVYSHTPIDSLKETKFVDNDTIKDRLLRKNIDELAYKKI